MEISLGSTLGYLDRAVGADLIRRSQIYFSVPPHVRTLVDKVLTETGYVPTFRGDGIPELGPVGDALAHESRGLLSVAVRYGPASRYYGDLYDLIRNYEITLHGFVREVLVAKYGVEQRRWWYAGVPLPVRQDCAARREELGNDDLDPWRCSVLLDLLRVADKQWALFEALFRPTTKPDFARDLKAVNEVRNRVMHPVRDAPPTDQDFDRLTEARLSMDSAVRVWRELQEDTDGTPIAIEERAEG